MILHIDRFEEDIHALITERGREYFEGGLVTNLQQTADGWMARMKVSENYEVLLKGHDEISHWECTCPFDHGPVCKHVAATLFAVREFISADQAGAAGRLDQRIDAASPEELRRILKILIRVHAGARAEVWKEFTR